VWPLRSQTRRKSSTREPRLKVELKTTRFDEQRGEIRRLEGNDLDVDEWEGEDDFVPRYNIAPRTNVPVIRRRDEGRGGPSDAGPSSSSDSSSNPSSSSSAPAEPAGSAPADAPEAPSESRPPTGQAKHTPPRPSAPTHSGKKLPLIMQTMKWGLIPHWAKVEDKSLNTINARGENLVAGGGIWGAIKARKRCAIPCEGCVPRLKSQPSFPPTSPIEMLNETIDGTHRYYEWLTKGKDKLPHFVKRKDGNLLLMAGLYDCALIDNQPLWTFTIVTTEANRDFDWLHERQPVFLTTKQDLETWLDTSIPAWTDALNRIVSRSYNDKSVPLDW